MISVIIPCYQEPFVNKTIQSMSFDAQILVVIDGYTPKEPIIKDDRVTVINNQRNLGMRGAINEGFKQATGDYLMKCDAHCAFGKDFDKVSFQENWLMIPRKYSLDFDAWKRSENKYIDYYYLNYPNFAGCYGWYTGPNAWNKKVDKQIDDTMSFQGSCWIANRKYFMDHVGFLDDRPETYGSFPQEQLEIGMKYWLGGGEIKVNKNIWYAHLSKRLKHYDQCLFSRKYKKNKMIPKQNEWSLRHWINNEEPNMIHPFNWLIEKFWPVPGWPEERSLWKFPL